MEDIYGYSNPSRVIKTVAKEKSEGLRPMIQQIHILSMVHLC